MCEKVETEIVPPSERATVCRHAPAGERRRQHHRHGGSGQDPFGKGLLKTSDGAEFLSPTIRTAPASRSLSSPGAEAMLDGLFDALFELSAEKNYSGLPRI